MTLKEAIEKNDINAVKQIISLNSTDINAKISGHNAIFYANKYENVDIINVLLSAGADSSELSNNILSQTELIRAINDNNLSLIEHLLKESNYSILYTRQALFAANRNRNMKIINLLLFYGADSSYLQSHILEQTELISNYSRTTFENFKMLIDKGKYNMTYLNQVYIWAARNNHYNLVKYLVQSVGVNINAIDEFRTTALIYASENGSEPIVKFLINKGADIDMKDCWEQRAVNYAWEKGHKDIAQLLISIEERTNVDDTYIDEEDD